MQRLHIYVISIVLTSSGSVCLAQITYDNGLTNTLGVAVAEPVIVTNETDLEITGIVDVDNDTYFTPQVVHVEDSSSVTVDGGTVGFVYHPSFSTGLRLVDGSIGSITSGMIEGGVKAVEVIDSQFDVQGGTIEAVWTKDATGIDATGSSIVSIDGGLVWADSEEPYPGVGLSAANTTIVSVSSGVISSTGRDGGGIGASFADSSQLTMTGGLIETTSTGDFSNTTGLLLGGSSSATVEGGAISSTHTPFSGTSIGVEATGDSYFEFTGGTVDSHIGFDFDDPGLFATGVLARNNAVAVICGGEINTSADLPANADDIVALDSAVIFLCASAVDFYPMFEPITDMDGVVSGVGLDGRRFHYSFHRDLAATIMIIPEPQIGGWALVIALGVLRRKRR